MPADSNDAKPAAPPLAPGEKEKKCVVCKWDKVDVQNKGRLVQGLVWHNGTQTYRPFYGYACASHLESRFKSYTYVHGAHALAAQQASTGTAGAPIPAPQPPEEPAE